MGLSNLADTSLGICRKADWRLLAAFGSWLNIADAVATTLEIAGGLATEGNPVMGAAYAHSILLFMLVKVLASLLFWFMGECSDRPVAKFGIGIGVSVYLGIAILHVVGLLAV